MADRVPSKALLIVLAATLALLAFGGAAFAPRAGAWIATGTECEECEPGGGGADWPDDWGDFPPEAGDGPGYPDTGGYSGDDEQSDQADDGSTEYEREHEGEIWELDIELKEDRDAGEERDAEREFDTAEAEEELRQMEEAEEELQRKIDYLHNEEPEERLARERAEVLLRHPELEALKEECEFLVREKTPGAFECMSRLNRQLQELMPPDPPAGLPRPSPGPRPRPYSANSSRRETSAKRSGHRRHGGRRAGARRAHRS